MQILGIIPARYDSTRLPGKALVDIGGKSMTQRVYEQAKKAQKLAEVIVATDDERIFNHIQSFGGKVMMTAKTHTNGTDRCAEVAHKLASDYQAVINIQGDEPFIDPAQIDEIAGLFADQTTEIATLAKKIVSYEELIDEKEAKVVLNQRNECVYMSRSAVPYMRGADISEWHVRQNYYKHIGIYGFRSDVLVQIPHLPVSELEKIEGLEQLRWLAYFKIKIGITQFETLAIDTAEDLKLIDKYLAINS
ncbi:MAG: 3-deoxy-manno-octulosonate cytidylyltransferase [Microscillaceae bacterium]|jgi:3-deoxy-manno-octulosonate cytidylyltransferase (CMP-KDO synthetase)|nr:3-deoxy-manno-octulosonate cytidylyltransferase [Microscillaceae bacterium]